MKKYMSPSDLKEGKGKHHTWEREELFQKYNKELKKYEKTINCNSR